MTRGRGSHRGHVDGVVRANNALINLAATSHAFAIAAGLPPGSSVHVVVDVFGYFE